MSSAQRLAVIPLPGTPQVVTPDNGLTILLVVTIAPTLALGLGIIIMTRRLSAGAVEAAVLSESSESLSGGTGAGGTLARLLVERGLPWHGVTVAHLR